MANVTIVNTPTQVQTIATSGQGSQGAGQSLQPGSLVSGTISGRDGGGNFLLRTDQGTISIQSSTPLTYNSDVVIQIGGGNNAGTTARIISVNGEPFASFSAPAPENADTVSNTATPEPQTAGSTTATPSTAAPIQTTSAPAAPPTNVSIPALVVSTPAPAFANSPTETASANSTNPLPADNTTTPTQNSPQLTAGTNVIIKVDTAPQATTQQAVVTPATAQTPTPGAGSESASSSVQAQGQAQALANEQTPTTVAESTNSQSTVFQQNTPNAQTSQPQEAETPTTTTQPNAPANEPAQPTAQNAATPAAQATTAPQSSALPQAATTLYAAYAKQPGVSQSTTATPSAQTPASPTAGNAQTNAAPTSVQGQVISNANGFINVQTPLGQVTLKTDALPASVLLSPGTNVTIETPLATALSAALAGEPATLTELAQSWGSLKDILNIANASNPEAGNALLARLPQLNTSFVSSSTAFVSTLLQGDARKLLGDDLVDTLRQNGRGDLVDKFMGELNSLGEAFSAPVGRETTGWQSLFLPFVYQEELQQARLYVKRDPAKKDNVGNKKSADTRFVIEVDMSELGPLQMDGLVRTAQQATAFDLVVRSRSAFTQEDQLEIAGIYAGAAELTGFKGTITFQVSRDFPVKPMEEIGRNIERNIMA